MPDEVHHHIAAHLPSDEVRLGNIERDIHNIKQNIMLIIQALGAEQLRQPGSPDGLAQTQAKQTALLKDMDDRIEALESRRDMVKLITLNVVTAVLGGSITGWIAVHFIK